jgi:hypothetical protein
MRRTRQERLPDEITGKEVMRGRYLKGVSSVAGKNVKLNLTTAMRSFTEKAAMTSLTLSLIV